MEIFQKEHSSTRGTKNGGALARLACRDRVGRGQRSGGFCDQGRLAYIYRQLFAKDQPREAVVARGPSDIPPRQRQAGKDAPVGVPSRCLAHSEDLFNRRRMVPSIQGMSGDICERSGVAKKIRRRWPPQRPWESRGARGGSQAMRASHRRT